MIHLTVFSSDYARSWLRALLPDQIQQHNMANDMYRVNKPLNFAVYYCIIQPHATKYDIFL